MKKYSLLCRLPRSFFFFFPYSDMMEDLHSRPPPTTLSLEARTPPGTVGGIHSPTTLLSPSDSFHRVSPLLYDTPASSPPSRFLTFISDVRVCPVNSRSVPFFEDTPVFFSSSFSHRIPAPPMGGLFGGGFGVGGCCAVGVPLIRRPHYRYQFRTEVPCLARAPGGGSCR